MFKTLLVAVDVNAMDGAERLAETANMIANADGAQIHVINVVPGAGMSMVGAALGAQHSSDMKAAAKAALDAWASSAFPNGAKTHVTEGTIYDSVIQTADRIKADVIVVGAHRPELRDYLVGPNAARIVRHSNQSVMVVR